MRNDSISEAMIDSDFEDVSDDIIIGLCYMAVQEAAAELSNMKDYRIRELPIAQREIVEENGEEWQEEIVFPAVDTVYFNGAISEFRKLFYDKLVPIAVTAILDSLQDIVAHNEWENNRKKGNENV